VNFIRKRQPVVPSRAMELRGLIFVAIVLFGGLVSVYQVKTQRPLPFGELAEKMSREYVSESGKRETKIPEIINLKEIKEAKELRPYLTVFESEAERDFAADKLYQKISTEKNRISSVGFLGTVRISQGDIKGKEDLDFFTNALADAAARAEERKKQEKSYINQIRDAISPRTETVDVAVLSAVGQVKSSFIVRTPSDFFYSVVTWSALFFISFFGLHLFWRFIGFSGDNLILPPIFLLCGIGFLMMLGMRDPLRDSFAFVDFSLGVAAGCLAMAAITVIDFQNCYLRFQQKLPDIADRLLTYLPISLAILFSLALILVGRTPGASDAKVNLNIGIAVIQPSEIIKILFVLFSAFYFGERWDYFRYLENKKLSGYFSFPRTKDIWLVALLVAGLLILFFLQKDLGPALLMAGMFLVVFAVVRRKTGLSIIGFLAIISGYIINYKLRISATAADRLDIWRNPWDTTVRGGEQIAHSLWALATGGLTGTGIGLGDPYVAPAHHTDLILSSVGEELGFAGLVLVFLCYTLLFYRCYVAAKNAFSPFTYLLAVGIGIINALQLLFIGAGVLGVVPLSGVVTPFLSYGMTSMICNFISFGILLAVSAEPGLPTEDREIPARYLAYGVSCLFCLLLLKAFYIQVWSGDDILIRPALAPVPRETIAGNEVTGIRRFTYNPRIGIAKKELPAGTIFDRNGIPLAGSKWDELHKFAGKYEALGIKLEQACKRGKRCYPFGNRMFHLLGDANTERQWSARNTDYIEQDYQKVLRGYDDHPELVLTKVTQKTPLRNKDGDPIIDPETKQPQYKIENEVDFPIIKRDYRELLPMVRDRYNPLNISANLLKFKDRDVHTSIDAEFQLRLTEILREELQRNKKTKGAIVVLDPRTGDLLASVSLPIPDDDALSDRPAAVNTSELQASLLDRARWGIYPPGSTFKLLTTMAAMRAAPENYDREFSCVPLSEGRVGNTVRGKVIKDDKGDNAHGTIKFNEALKVSCNAYFAQLGTEVAGANEIFKTAAFFNIGVAEPASADELNKYLPQSSFGQGEVYATPFQIAKLSAAVSNQGAVQQGRWVTDENNLRNTGPIQVITPQQAVALAGAMRSVVTGGTGRKNLADVDIEIAGKTGTAENPFGQSHSWFTGFAPYTGGQQQIAFAVLVENGGYGGDIATRVAGRVVRSAKELGIIR
jgi:cell division protein FtsW (lipid II flippase)